MRLRKVNQRRKRCVRKVTEKTGVPFCYILYAGTKTSYVRGAMASNGFFSLGSWRTDIVEKKRMFPSYRVLIAHLTRVKLNITEENPKWTRLRACKIVEGWYTKTGKEIVTKEYELPDERNSSVRRRDERRLLRKQRRSRFPISKNMGPTYQLRASGSSGTTTTSGTTPTVDTGWNASAILSDWDNQLTLSSI